MKPLTDEQRAWRWKIAVAWVTGGDWDGKYLTGVNGFAAHREMKRAVKWARRAMPDEYRAIRQLAAIKRDADRLIGDLGRDAACSVRTMIWVEDAYSSLHDA